MCRCSPARSSFHTDPECRRRKPVCPPYPARPRSTWWVYLVVSATACSAHPRRAGPRVTSPCVCHGWTADDKDTTVNRLHTTVAMKSEATRTLSTLTGSVLLLTSRTFLLFFYFFVILLRTSTSSHLVITMTWD